MDDEFDVGQSIPYQHGQFPRQDSASSALPAREAAAGFKGALKKVANGIAGQYDGWSARLPVLNICLSNTWLCFLYHVVHPCSMSRIATKVQ